MNDEADSDVMRPPVDVSVEAAAMWKRIFDESEFDEAGRLLLDELARQFDRLASARRVLKTEGLTIRGRYGSKLHPMVLIERDAANSLLKVWRLLGFDQAPPSSQEKIQFGRGSDAEN